MNEDELKAIEMLADKGYSTTVANDIPKLVAEVRRLQVEVRTTTDAFYEREKMHNEIINQLQARERIAREALLNTLAVLERVRYSIDAHDTQHCTDAWQAVNDGRDILISLILRHVSPDPIEEGIRRSQRGKE